jgi:hypothetical protein
MGLCGLLSALLACGGGSQEGTSGPVVVDTFALRSAYTTLMSGPWSKQMLVSGACTGTANYSNGFTSSAVFESLAVIATTTTVTTNLTDCDPASVATSRVLYRDAQFNTLGSTDPGLEYAVYQGTPAPLPTSAKRGDTAVEVVHTLYEDSSKTVATGQRVYSWAVEADTGITAIANFITRDYDSKNLLVLTQQARFRIDASGKLDLVTFDVQSVAAKPGHWLYTAL